jgi:hypothetical protein
MATKREELEKLARGEGCLAKAADDEPIFILVGDDKFAPALVVLWVELAITFGSPRGKFQEAARLLTRMRQWQEDHPDRVKVPD